MIGGHEPATINPVLDLISGERVNAIDYNKNKSDIYR